jgi:hypothetical protein
MAEDAGDREQQPAAAAGGGGGGGGAGGPREDGGGREESSVKLFVGQVPKLMTEAELAAMFRDVALVDEVTVIRDKATKVSRGESGSVRPTATMPFRLRPCPSPFFFFSLTGRDLGAVPLLCVFRVFRQVALPARELRAGRFLCSVRAKMLRALLLGIVAIQAQRGAVFRLLVGNFVRGLLRLIFKLVL